MTRRHSPAPDCSPAWSPRGRERSPAAPCWAHFPTTPAPRPRPAFYAEALKRARLAGELRSFAEIVGGHEREHVRFVRAALGRHAQAAPKLDFGDDTADAERFARSALRLEDLGVKAYFTQAASLRPATLAQVGRIATVESRHAAWIRDLAGLDPAPDPVEPTLDAKTVRQTLKGSGYVR
jgi:hypothetical protein